MKGEETVLDEHAEMTQRLKDLFAKQRFAALYRDLAELCGR